MQEKLTWKVRHKVMARMWRKGNPSALLVGMQINAVTVESGMELPQKIKNRSLLWPQNSTYVWKIHRECMKKPKTLIWKNISKPMFIAALFTIAKMMAQVPIRRWVDKTVVHLHNGILLSHKKQNVTLCNNSMDRLGEHYAKWNTQKSVSEK